MFSWNGCKVKKYKMKHIFTEEKIISHVGIYLRNNKFFAANQNGGVEIASLKKPYWKKNFMAAGRYKQ